MTSSLTTPLEELRREIDALKIDKTQLRTNNAIMKDEIGQLTTALDKMAVNNENQIQQINSQSSEIATMKDENRQLKAENVKLKARHVNTSRSLHAPPAPPKAIEHKLKVSQ